MEMHVIEYCTDVDGEEVLWLRALASDISVTLGRSLKLPGPTSNLLQKFIEG